MRPGVPNEATALDAGNRRSCMLGVVGLAPVRPGVGRIRHARGSLVRHWAVARLGRADRLLNVTW